MNWYKIAQLYSINEDDNDRLEDMGLDINHLYDQIDDSFSKSQIRVNRNKQLTHVMLDDQKEKAIGGIYSEWEKYEDDVMSFSFDIAINPENRGNVKKLFELIRGGIERYENEKDVYEEMGYHTIIRVWVVNPKLVPVLMRFGFEIESEYSNGSAHMVKY